MGFQLMVNGISLGAVYALIAVGFALVFSVLKFSNFAHGGMISACAFIGFFFQNAFKPAPSIFITILFTSLCGMLIAVILDTTGYRRIRKNKSPGIYNFLSSLAFAIMIEQILAVVFGKNLHGYPAIFKQNTFEFFGIRFSSINMMILAVSLLILVVLIIFIDHTRIGLAIRAVAINPDTSQLMGINSGVIVLAVLIISGFLAGISGVFLGVKYSVYPAVGSTMMLKGFIASVIGGLGSLGGAIFAAIMLGLIEMFLTYFIGAIATPVVLFAVMLLFLFLRPQGISGRIVKEKV
jgi:branched-chain amino acid transport system permease protein